MKFEVDDAELDWTNSEDFDFIHLRWMAARIKDWPRLIGQAFRLGGCYRSFSVRVTDSAWTGILSQVTGSSLQMSILSFTLKMAAWHETNLLRRGTGIAQKPCPSMVGLYLQGHI